MKSVAEIGEHPLELFNFLLDETRAGHRCVLITVVAVEGASSRAVGAHMVVSDQGVFAGYVSNGCVDADVALQALETLKDGAPRRVRYGAGSPYLDIRLPCGGSIDILMTPSPSREIIKQAVDTLANRKPARMLFTAKGEVATGDSENVSDGAGGIVIAHAPPLQIQIAGRGNETIELTKLACTAKYLVGVWSPDEMVLEEAKKNGAPVVTPLQSFGDIPAFPTDPWTAIVLMFHDHEWEADILAAALQTNAFYIGAMASRKTHALRIEELKARGIGADALTRIRGPIGLVPSMRDAPRLAISALAEIIDADSKAVR